MKNVMENCKPGMSIQDCRVYIGEQKTRLNFIGNETYVCEI